MSKMLKYQMINCLFVGKNTRFIEQILVKRNISLLLPL